MPPRSFSIARLETARRDWGRCVAEGGCAPGAEAGDPWAPVTGVSAAEAEAYCARMGGRLPDAVEWQAAGWWTPAHDGLRSRPWGIGEAGGRANLAGGADGYDGIAPVGSFPAGASAFGVEDLVGNAAEWVRAVEAETGKTGAVWVAGGSWSSGDEGAAAGVFAASDGEARPDVGFRCARE
ncbi:SUMF1/EgtB/PvdO family nonheme iron enzyme [Myxococcota bacterium]|nr:SUMF1/EgtB/PvdO family nonheme iron enzyme [Myxococcota bacterium]